MVHMKSENNLSVCFHRNQWHQHSAYSNR